MYKFIDLFAGIGGIRLAFEKSGCECIFSSEIDKNAKETYYQNFKEYPEGDITKININNIPDFDILTAGFPCQPFSIAGKRKGFEDSRGTLFFYIAKILNNKKPKAFFLENVRGLITHDKGRTIKIIRKILKEIGYVFEEKIINAKDFGIPQNRDRWYAVGFRNDLNIKFDQDFIFPKKRELKFSVKDILDKNVEGYKITEKAKENININIKRKNIKLTKDQLLIANEIRPSRCSLKDNGISPCLTAKMGTGGNNIPVIVNENRKLTERECLRLMGFPENFKIRENKYQSYKQIGNSVIVPIVQEIAENIVRSLIKQESNKKSEIY